MIEKKVAEENTSKGRKQRYTYARVTFSPGAAASELLINGYIMFCGRDFDSILAPYMIFINK